MKRKFLSLVPYYFGSDYFLRLPSLQSDTLSTLISTFFTQRFREVASEFRQIVEQNLDFYYGIGCAPLSISSKESTPVEDGTSSFCERSAARRLWVNHGQLCKGIPLNRELKMVVFQAKETVVGVMFPAGDVEGRVHTLDLHALNAEIGHELTPVETLVSGTVNPASFSRQFPQGRLIVSQDLVESTAESVFTNLETNPTCTTVELPRKTLLTTLQSRFSERLVILPEILVETSPEKIAKSHIQALQRSPKQITKERLKSWIQNPQLSVFILMELAKHGLFTMPIGEKEEESVSATIGLPKLDLAPDLYDRLIQVTLHHNHTPSLEELARNRKRFQASQTVRESLLGDRFTLRQYKVLVANAALEQKLPAFEQWGAMMQSPLALSDTHRRQFLVLLSSFSQTELTVAPRVTQVLSTLQLTPLEQAILEAETPPTHFDFRLQNSLLMQAGISPFYLAVLLGKTAFYEVLSKLESPKVQAHLRTFKPASEDQANDFVDSTLSISIPWTRLPLEAPFCTTRKVLESFLALLDQQRRVLTPHEQDRLLANITQIGIAEPFKTPLGKAWLSRLISQCRSDTRDKVTQLVCSGDYRFIQILGEIMQRCDGMTRGLFFGFLDSIQVPAIHKVSAVMLAKILHTAHQDSSQFTVLFGTA